MSREVEWEPVAIDQVSKFMGDAGLAALMDAVDALADDPEPPGVMHFGRSAHRLRVGPYRVMYEITDATIYVTRVGRTAAR